MRMWHGRAPRFCRQVCFVRLAPALPNSLGSSAFIRFLVEKARRGDDAS